MACLFWCARSVYCLGQDGTDWDVLRVHGRGEAMKTEHIETDRSRSVQKAVESIPEASARLGIGRTLGYELARAGRFPVPVIRLGRRMVVSKAAIERLLSGDTTIDTQAEGQNDGSAPVS